MKCTSEENFLNILFDDLHISNEVLFTSEKSDNPEQKIRKYLNRIEEVINKVKESKRNREISKIFFYKKYICNKLSLSFIKAREKIMERKLNDEDIKEILEIVRKNQKNTLDRWLDFFVDSNYPVWFKYYTLRGVLKSGGYDKFKDIITRRTPSSAYPFLEFNSTIISKMYDYLSNLIGKEFDENSLGALNFQKLYIKFAKENKSISDEGIWVKYPKNSPYEILCSDINGYNTGWCINQKEIAENYLSLGEIEIFYTKDSNGDFKIPRIAIRMFGNSIQEIRGVADNQNLEKSMLKPLEEKLESFSYIGSYKKTIQQFKAINRIEEKVNNDAELTNDELCLLYEIGEPIESFGYEKEKRIIEIRNKRNIKQDLNKIFSEVDCKDKCLFLDYLEDVEGIVFPKSFYELDLSGLKTLDNLVLDDEMTGSLIFNNIEELNNFVFPKKVNGTIEFEKLKRATNVIFPEVIGKNLNLYSLENFENVSFPKEIGDTFSLSSIKYLENFIFPTCKSINLRELLHAKNLIFQDHLNGEIDLQSLRNGENIILPNYIGGRLSLQSLITADGIDFPMEYSNEIELKLIKDMSNLSLPQKIKKLLIPNSKIEEVDDLIKGHEINELYLDKYYTKEQIEKYFEEKKFSK